MLGYFLPLESPFDEWVEYILPKMCTIRIEDVCEDILKRGESTRYGAIYNAIYELVEADISLEHVEALYD